MSTHAFDPPSPSRRDRPRQRLVTAPFLAVTASALVFFVYIGMLVVVVPRFVEERLGAGEFGVGLTIATFAAAAIASRPLIGWAGDRFGRRRLMMAGAVLAAAAGAMSGFAGSLPVLLMLRGATGVGEAAMFVGAATMIADLAPPHRRAEAASYFSVAVFGGIGVGPIIGEWVLADDRYVLAFGAAGAVALLAALLAVAVPRRIDQAVIERSRRGQRVRPRFLHPAALWPGVVLGSGIAGFAVFSAFLPEYSRSVGLSGAGGLFFVYSMVTLVLRIAGARVPERIGAGTSVTIALVLLAVGLVLPAVVPSAGGLWAAAAVVGVGMAFMYPSLMALVVNRVDERERASALSSFTMFFEVGTVVGGIVLGSAGELLGKPAAFVGGSLMCLFGLVVLWTRVVDTRTAAPSPRVDYVPVAGD
jgi:MFS family permease